MNRSILHVIYDETRPPIVVLLKQGLSGWIADAWDGARYEARDGAVHVEGGTYVGKTGAPTLEEATRRGQELVHEARAIAAETALRYADLREVTLPEVVALPAYTWETAR